MSDQVFRIGGAGAPQGPEPGQKGAAPDSTEFRRILERLEQLSKSKEDAEVRDADELQDAMREAEDEYRTVMDLRRALEDAYRKQSP